MSTNALTAVGRLKYPHRCLPTADLQMTQFLRALRLFTQVVLLSVGIINRLLPSSSRTKIPTSRVFHQWKGYQLLVHLLFDTLAGTGTAKLHHTAGT